MSRLVRFCEARYRNYGITGIHSGTHARCAFSMADLKAAILLKWRYFLYIHSDAHKIRVGCLLIFFLRSIKGLRGRVISKTTCS
jgi:proteasome lid subunit RPN8/RPN11